MNEAFLHFIWQTQQFNHRNLCLQTGEALQILQAGTLNNDAGPDFFNGQIVLDNTRWAGNIEIHLKSSDWLLHHHHLDGNYSNIILHVVWEEDEVLFFNTGVRIPTLVLKGKVPSSLWKHYQNMGPLFHFIPCEREVGNKASLLSSSFYRELIIERLDHRANVFFKMYNNYKGDWEKCFYHVLFQAFGFRLNAVPMDLLFRHIPFNILRKLSQNIFSLEALLCGTAGFLGEPDGDEYYIQLKEEYLHLKNLYKLRGLQKDQWKFLRTRPGNFPSIRIAQLAALLNKHQSLFQKFISIQQITEMETLFRSPVHGYWSNHFYFMKPKIKRSSAEMGINSIQLLILNAVLPFLHFYHLQMKDLKALKANVDCFAKIPPENNNILNSYSKLGFKISSAMHSQALLQQYKHHCKLKKCLTCKFGISLLKVQNHVE